VAWSQWADEDGPLGVFTIREIQAVPLIAPLRRTFRGSNYEMSKRCTVITRILTSEGVIGESYNGDEEGHAQVRLVRTIRDVLAPLLIGRDATMVEACWEAVLPTTYDILGDRALAMKAIACVDSALWDLVGKSLGAPLYKVWGGFREELPIIAIGGYYGRSAAELGAEVESYREMGLAGCKFKVGGATPEEDGARFRTARLAAGDDFILMADANQGYTLEEAKRFCGLVADLSLRWFEEPCRWYNDRRAMRDLRLSTGVQTAAGQSELSRSGARDLMVDSAIDVCNFDASWAGGPTEWRRVAGMALAFGVDMGHHEEPQISAHLLAAIPHGTYVECFHPERDPLFWELIANRPAIKDGSYPIPQGPGFGLVLDEATIRRYAA
jgi:D-galactarolactone cycloisomerase